MATSSPLDIPSLFPSNSNDPIHFHSSAPPPFPNPPGLTEFSNPHPPPRPPRRLGWGKREVYDVDGERPGPQLQAMLITKYASDPKPLLGRQIAANRTYLCYGLKQGSIRVLNLDTALRTLLCGHSEKVTDMAFFAENIHLLASASADGRLIVWKIDEELDAETKPQIRGNIVIAIQIVGGGTSYHPRICWHPYRQEFLFVAIGKYVMKIDTVKVSKGQEFAADRPLQCHVKNLIGGVQSIGKHDGDITDLSISRWMTTYLVSASVDGMVKIWEDNQVMPIATLLPHDGQPVHAVAFLMRPHCPDHVVLITAGPLNRELKLWVCTNKEVRRTPSDSESWHCTQSLELRSYAEPQFEDALFNQVVVLSHANLIILANSKKSAIYTVHVDYGPHPFSTHMDCVAEFSLTMPILSFTVNQLFDGEKAVHVYCIQTEAIQQYNLDMSLCLPPLTDSVGSDKDMFMTYHFDSSGSGGYIVLEPDCDLGIIDLARQSPSPILPVPLAHAECLQSTSCLGFSTSSDVNNSCQLTATAEVQSTSSPLRNGDVVTALAASFSFASNLDASATQGGFGSPQICFASGSSISDYEERPFCHYYITRRENPLATTPPFIDMDVNSGKDEDTGRTKNTPIAPGPNRNLKPSTKIGHLRTLWEASAEAISCCECTSCTQSLGAENTDYADITSNSVFHYVDKQARNVGQSCSSQSEEVYRGSKPEIIHTVNKDDHCLFHTSKSCTQTTGGSCSLECNTYGLKKTSLLDVAVVSGAPVQHANSHEGEDKVAAKVVPQKVSMSAINGLISQPSAAVREKQQARCSHASSSLALVSSSAEPVSNATDHSMEATRLPSVQETLNQIVIMLKEIQELINVNLGLPNNERERLEEALGRSMEKVVKANVDTLWSHLQEEYCKHDKIGTSHAQDMANSITEILNKDLDVMLGRMLKKEISTTGTSVSRTITSVIEKTISSAIANSFKRVLGDKAIGQLEKSLSRKLQAAVSRQIQAEFQMIAKQALKDTLESNLETLVVPAFEQSWRVMFNEVDATFRKGFSEHTATCYQQLVSIHTSLAVTLKDAITSAASVIQNLGIERTEQHKLLALMAAGSVNASSPTSVLQANDPLGGLPNLAGNACDLKEELRRLIAQAKVEEAFTVALHWSDVIILSWLCSEVDLQAICSTVPLPLNQGVLLSLLQQLSSDLSKETAKKLAWMTEIASTIDPTDPLIKSHVRLILEQVYGTLVYRRSIPTTTPYEAGGIRLLCHVIYSVLRSCH